MQIAIVGAGAVGCYYGGLLARAGHDVIFIGRRPHVDAINSQGLLLETHSFKGYLPAKAATDASALVSPDLVLFCVKSADTEQAGQSLTGRLRPETSILRFRMASIIRSVSMPSLDTLLFLPWSMSGAKWSAPAMSNIMAVVPS